jgi:hypothetical protein
VLKSIGKGLLQNWGLEVLAVIIGVLFYCGLWFSLFLFGRHDVTTAPKKKHFFIGISFLVTVFFGLVLILDSMMSSVARHLNQQVEDMRIAAVGRENRGLYGDIVLAGPGASNNNPKYAPTNYTATLQGMPSSPLNSTLQSGVDMDFVLHIYNSGPPTIVWNFKSYIILPDSNGKQVDAIIPSLLISKNSKEIATIDTPVGPYQPGNFRQHFASRTTAT